MKACTNMCAEHAEGAVHHPTKEEPHCLGLADAPDFQLAKFTASLFLLIYKSFNMTTGNILS